MSSGERGSDYSYGEGFMTRLTHRAPVPFWLLRKKINLEKQNKGETG